jgi:cell fate regulator YaaT (PSP1 superfamily)
MTYKKIFHKMAKEFNLEVRPTAMFFGKRVVYPDIAGSMMKWYEKGDEFYLATDVKVEHREGSEYRIAFTNVHQFYGSYEAIRLEVMKLLEKVKKAKIETKISELEGDFQ